MQNFSFFPCRYLDNTRHEPGALPSPVFLPCLTREARRAGSDNCVTLPQAFAIAFLTPFQPDTKKMKLLAFFAADAPLRRGYTI